jgi:hypothetical protein
MNVSNNENFEPVNTSQSASTKANTFI